MKNLIKYFWIIVLITAILSKTLFAQCYNLYRPLPNSVWHWTNNSVTFYVNTNGSRSFSSPHTTEANAISSAFNTWENVEPSSLDFNSGGFESATVANDGKSVLYWDNNPNLSRYVKASLTLWGNATTGVLTNVDIWFNDYYYQWTDGTLDFDSDIMDIQSIATHEIGHLLGLTHSDPCTDNAPTMMDGETWRLNFASTAESPTLGIRSLAQGDINGINYLYGSTLHVPEVFSSIAEAIGFAQSGQTILVSSGTYTIGSSITVQNGVTLQINSGVTLKFASGKYLTVNGTLNAVGTSSNRITFNFDGSSGTWGGIQVNNHSYSYLQFCNINNASTGVYINNNSNRTMVSDCQINNSDYYGIYVYNSQPTLLRNRIVNQPNTGAFGILSNYYGFPYIKDNLIKGFGTAGIYCVDHAGVFWTNSTANNVIKENYHGLYSNYYSNIYLGNTSNNGFNSIYSNSVYDVKALDYSTSYVQNNWWGVYPPNATKFYNDASSAIIRTNPLSSDPNSGLFMIAPNDNGRINADISLSTSIANNSLEYGIATNDDFSNEINLLLDLFKKNSNDKAGRNSLISIEYLFTKSGRKDFMDFSKKELRPFIKGSDELYPLILELEMHQLLNNGDMKQALTYNDTLETKINDKTVNKYALFRKGFLYLTQMNDLKSAEGIFAGFVKKYPQDELVYIINNLLNKNNGANSSNFTLLKEGENNLLNKEGVTEEFKLDDCYPNPFNPSTKISFTIPQKENVKLRVFDVLGRAVSILADGVYESGKYEVNFDAGNLPSGVYFYNLTTSSNSISKKMLLVK